MQGWLLTVAGVAESLVGLAFLLAPGVTTALLLGAEPDSMGTLKTLYGPEVDEACVGLRPQPF
jgi:hypothetical protein